MIRRAFGSRLLANGLPGMPAPVAGSTRSTDPPRVVGSDGDAAPPLMPALRCALTWAAVRACPYTATSSIPPGQDWVPSAPASVPVPIRKGWVVPVPGYCSVADETWIPSRYRVPVEPVPLIVP